MIVPIIETYQTQGPNGPITVTVSRFNCQGVDYIGGYWACPDGSIARTVTP